ncbi:hypothetical protein [Vandammella animalimorsus]|nr:hypothetical protein [Vandammella animalimorsus]
MRIPRVSDGGIDILPAPQRLMRRQRRSPPIAKVSRLRALAYNRAL